MTTFLAHNIRYINKNKSDLNFTENLLNAYNYYLAINDLSAMHIIGCRLALYNFFKHSHYTPFWLLYLYHKNAVFSFI